MAISEIRLIPLNLVILISLPHSNRQARITSLSEMSLAIRKKGFRHICMLQVPVCLSLHVIYTEQKGAKHLLKVKGFGHICMLQVLV